MRLEKMIILSKIDSLFMLNILHLTPELCKILEFIRDNSGGGVDEDIADELRDLCTDRLDEIGFGKNYEPTKEGEKLEDLIDKLFIG